MSSFVNNLHQVHLIDFHFIVTLRKTCFLYQFKELFPDLFLFHSLLRFFLFLNSFNSSKVFFFFFHHRICFPYIFSFLFFSFFLSPFHARLNSQKFLFSLFFLHFLRFISAKISFSLLWLLLLYSCLCWRVYSPL